MENNRNSASLFSLFYKINNIQNNHMRIKAVTCHWRAYPHIAPTYHRYKEGRHLAALCWNNTGSRGPPTPCVHLRQTAASWHTWAVHTAESHLADQTKRCACGLRGEIQSLSFQPEAIPACPTRHGCGPTNPQLAVAVHGSFSPATWTKHQNPLF